MFVVSTRVNISIVVNTLSSQPHYTIEYSRPQMSHYMRFPTTIKASDPPAHTGSLIRAYASGLNTF